MPNSLDLCSTNLPLSYSTKLSGIKITETAKTNTNLVSTYCNLYSPPRELRTGNLKPKRIGLNRSGKQSSQITDLYTIYIKYLCQSRDREGDLGKVKEVEIEIERGLESLMKLGLDYQAGDEHKDGEGRQLTPGQSKCTKSVTNGTRRTLHAEQEEGK